jgi:NADPH-dependent curcumin reductase CurA
MKSRQIVLASRPHGLPSSENFRFEDRETGSDEKCKLLKEQFGFDEAINYKTAKSMATAIATVCPKVCGFELCFLYNIYQAGNYLNPEFNKSCSQGKGIFNNNEYQLG